MTRAGPGGAIAWARSERGAVSQRRSADGMCLSCDRVRDPSWIAHREPNDVDGAALDAHAVVPPPHDAENGCRESATDSVTP